MHVRRVPYRRQGDHLLILILSQYSFSHLILTIQGLGAGYQLTTNYSENFLKFSGTSKPKRYHPDNDPITKDLTTMRQVPREIKPLYSGTPISTGHIAGYLGHVPKKLSNERKIEHSLGHSRPMQNNLLLTQRGLGCVLGYSGNTFCIRSLFELV